MLQQPSHLKPTRRIYSENSTGLSAGYAQLSKRLCELSMASFRSGEAIDALLWRLRQHADQPTPA